ncbi:lysylphosphatidylglycerol synthase transmembrane domain-containing protein [Neptunitalea chrysea]|nr:lysylphosphatidylglycerol synthase transmembrane domain-containing protein [Neptunitalea chrysea]
MNIKKIASFILPLSLGVFLIWYSLSKFTPQQITEIKHYFKNANYWYVIISISFGFLSHLSRAYRWNFMLRPMGYNPSLANNAMAVFSGYIMNMFIPRSGEFSRALVVNKYEDVPYDKALGSIIAERVADLIVLGLIVATAFFIQIDILKEYLLETVNTTLLLSLMAGATVLGLTFLWFIYKTNTKISLKIRGLVSGIMTGVLSIIKMDKKWAFIAHTIFIWIMYLSMFYINIYALPQTQNMEFGVVLSAFIIGSFTIAFTNGGFGSYPFAIAEILSLFGVTLTVGTAFGWIIWIAQFVMLVFFGGLSLILLPIYNKNK